MRMSVHCVRALRILLLIGENKRSRRVKMRLDKFLKVSRILKRRTVANEACHGGKVSVNGRTAKPGAQIKPGDKVAIAFAGGQLVFVVNQVKESVKKDEAAQMYTILQDE